MYICYEKITLQITLSQITLGPISQIFAYECFCLDQSSFSRPTFSRFDGVLVPGTKLIINLIIIIKLIIQRAQLHIIARINCSTLSLAHTTVAKKYCVGYYVKLLIQYRKFNYCKMDGSQSITQEYLYRFIERIPS